MGRKVPERLYRGSRICRVLGNPTAYEILKLLGRGKRQPTELADMMNLSKPTVSVCLRTLRNLDLIRYDNLRQGKFYYIKEPSILDILERIEALVNKIQKANY
jgi:DNA-binding transcriptional ArsR family regulator